MREVAVRPGLHTPPAASKPQSPSTLHPAIFGATPLRLIVQRAPMQVHVPGRGLLLSHPTNGVAPTQRSALHSSSHPQSLSAVQNTAALPSGTTVVAIGFVALADALLVATDAASSARIDDSFGAEPVRLQHSKRAMNGNAR